MTYKDITFCMAPCMNYNMCPITRNLEVHDMEYLKQKNAYVSLADFSGQCGFFVEREPPHEENLFKRIQQMVGVETEKGD